MPATWKPDSWRGKPIVQTPTYPDQAALEAVERDLRNFPPLVFVKRGARRSSEQLAAVAEGQSFLLQGGDCAESFKEHKTDYIRDYFQLFLQMALILVFHGNRRVVKVGRVAGQFAKPRSSDIEKKDGEELPSYRGDIINGPEFTAEARIPDPRRQLQAYRQSAATLNFLRALLDGGYASLANAHRWELKFMEGTPIEARYDDARQRDRAHGGGQPPPRHHRGEHPGDAHHQLLHQPRGPAARLRGGAHPPRRGDGLRRLGRHLGAPPVDRRPHAPAGRRARGVLPRHRQSDRPEVRAVAAAGRAAAPDRHPQSEGRAGPAHADLPLRRRQDREAPAGADPRRRAGRAHGGVVVRPHARQHHHGRRRATRRGRSTGS